MKVAVISAVPTSGKSCLIELLGSVYSRSQGRTVSVFSTGDAKDNIDIIHNEYKDNKIDSAHVFKSMIEGAGANQKELFNYGIQAGDEQVYIYDILNTSMGDVHKEELLVNAINTVPTNLTLIEICGNVDSELNTKVLNECDCALILVDTSLKGILEYKKLFNNLPNMKLKINKCIVMAQSKPVVVSDKRFAELLSIKTTELFKFPSNDMIAKYALQANLDKLAYNIIFGEYDVVNLRMPLQEIMEFIFDTPTRKLIRSVDKWYR